MARPDIATLACVNPECQRFKQVGLSNLSVRKVYGQDHIRLLRCSQCKEEFSERRSSPFFNTKISQARATSVIEHLGEGCGLRPTARLLKVSKDTLARLLKVAGRHAAKFHDQRVRGLRAQALEFDQQWSFVKKSSAIVALRNLSAGICGTR